MHTTGSKRLRRTLHAEEERIAGLPHEEASAYTLDGTPTFERVTQRRRGDVYFTPRQQRRLKNAVVTHNHPSARSFSYADVALALEHDLAEIRAVGMGPDGRRYTYQLRRPADGWPDEPLVWQQVLEARSAVAEYLGRAVQAGELTRAAAIAMIRHEIWKRVSNRLGLSYRRIVR